MIAGFILPLILLFVITFILLVILMRTSSFSFTKFYFTIVSIVSIIGMAIAFGIAIYQQGMQHFITDDEYLSSRGHRELQQCEEPLRKAVTGNTESQQVEKTDDEIATCKQAATMRVSKERAFQTKEATIGGLTRGVIFLLLFLTHYPRMIKGDAEVIANTKSNKATATKKRIAKK